MNDSDRLRLRHMLDAGREALSFIEGRTSADLVQDRMLLLAVVKEIEMIGEAAARVSATGREAVPAIPWTLVVGIRNRLIHGYFDIDLAVIWSTLSSDLPDLVRNLQAALASEE